MIKKIFAAIGFAILAVAGLAFLGYLTMWLWNWLMPYLFHLPTLGYWQAFGLLLLSKILFGGFRVNADRGWKRNWREKMEKKMASMTPEERDEFRRKMEERCGWKYSMQFKNS